MTPDPLIDELRGFVLTFAEHDPDCPGFDAQGPAAVDPNVCACGLMPRLEELLTEVEKRLA